MDLPTIHEVCQHHTGIQLTYRRRAATPTAPISASVAFSAGAHQCRFQPVVQKPPHHLPGYRKSAPHLLEIHSSGKERNAGLSGQITCPGCRPLFFVGRFQPVLYTGRAVPRLQPCKVFKKSFSSDKSRNRGNPACSAKSTWRRVTGFTLPQATKKGKPAPCLGELTCQTSSRFATYCKESSH